MAGSSHEVLVKSQKRRRYHKRRRDIHRRSIQSQKRQHLGTGDHTRLGNTPPQSYSHLRYLCGRIALMHKVNKGYLYRGGEEGKGKTTCEKLPPTPEIVSSAGQPRQCLRGGSDDATSRCNSRSTIVSEQTSCFDTERARWAARESPRDPNGLLASAPNSAGDKPGLSNACSTRPLLASTLECLLLSVTVIDRTDT